MNEGRDGLQEIIDDALEEMAAEAGEGFDPQTCNLAGFCRRTGLDRSRARTIGRHGFRVLPHGNCGRRATETVPSGYTGIVDSQPRLGVTNSQVIFERLLGQSYEGGLTTVKACISGHGDLVPAKRRQAAPQGSRGQGYRTGPGGAYQMDRGFAGVGDREGGGYRVACLAMVCHHCGTPCVGLFPNARQESLLVGMLHAFMAMGVPEVVLTDNMRSVVTGRDADGRPVWQRDHAALMGAVGFRTRLCRPRHPLTKGKAERLMRFVRESLLAGMGLAGITSPNGEALLWRASRAGRWRRAVACVPADGHGSACRAVAREPEVTDGVAAWLRPRRRISLDGFVSYEGRRLGVPYWYDRGEHRVSGGAAGCTCTAPTSPGGSACTP